MIHALRRVDMVDVAQLVRVTDCGSEGRGFESLLPPCRESDEDSLFSWVGRKTGAASMDLDGAFGCAADLLLCRILCRCRTFYMLHGGSAADLNPFPVLWLHRSWPPFSDSRRLSGRLVIPLFVRQCSNSEHIPGLSGASLKRLGVVIRRGNSFSRGGNPSAVITFFAAKSVRDVLVLGENSLSFEKCFPNVA